jgi:hypothetical protein
VVKAVDVDWIERRAEGVLQGMRARGIR